MNDTAALGLAAAIQQAARTDAQRLSGDFDGIDRSIFDIAVDRAPAHVDQRCRARDAQQGDGASALWTDDAVIDHGDRHDALLGEPHRSWMLIDASLFPINQLVEVDQVGAAIGSIALIFSHNRTIAGADGNSGDS
jgi:hypothetical protein